MASLFTEIVVDSHDPAALAEFWSEVLAWPVTADPRGMYWMTRTGQPQDVPILVFVPVPEPKTVKNRVHLDVSPLNCSQAEELERLLALGATRTDVGQGDAPWTVLADPEGNEFCLLGRRIDL